MEENEGAWSVILAGSSQLRWSGGYISAPVGFDVVALDVIRRAKKIKAGHEFWDRVAVVEAVVVGIYAKRVKQNG
jgi:hypothetical protein